MILTLKVSTVALNPSTCDKDFIGAAHRWQHWEHRRLVMHTCVSHYLRLICFTTAFDPSCVCSPKSPTTVSSKSSNCRATPEVRICCCVFPLSMRSIMFRPCSRRNHLLPHLNPANTRTERTLNKDAVHRDGASRKFEGHMVCSMF